MELDERFRSQQCTGVEVPVRLFDARVPFYLMGFALFGLSFACRRPGSSSLLNLNAKQTPSEIQLPEHHG